MPETVTDTPRRFQRMLARSGKFMFKAASFDSMVLPDWLLLELIAEATEIANAFRSNSRRKPLPLNTKQERALRRAYKLMMAAQSVRTEPLDVMLRLRLLRCAEEMQQIRKARSPVRSPTR